MKTYRFLLVALALALLTVMACAGPGGKGTGVRQVAFPEMTPPSPGPIKVEPYRVMKGDALSVTFPMNSNLTVNPALVRNDGKISLSLVGELPVYGLTIPEVKEAISNKYKEFIAKTRYSRVFKGGDYFDIHFVYNPELNIGVRVDADGYIQLPLVGVVPAAGLTPEELRQDLIQKYSRTIRNPDIAVLVGVHVNAAPLDIATKKIFEDLITVALVKSAGQWIFVGGEVATAKAVPYEGHLTTLQAIMAAGGTRETADLSRVVVLRRGPFEQAEWIQTDLASPRDGASLKNDVALKTGDIVLVPMSGIAKLNLWVKQYIRDVLPIQTQGAVGAYWQPSTLVP